MNAPLFRYPDGCAEGTPVLRVDDATKRRIAYDQRKRARADFDGYRRENENHWFTSLPSLSTAGEAPIDRTGGTDVDR